MKNQEAIHPVCRLLREFRLARGLTLADIKEETGVSPVVWGSYERGDRNPPLSKMEDLLRCFGYTLVAVPIRADAVRVPQNIVAELRAIADQLEKKNVVSKLSQSAAHPA